MAMMNTYRPQTEEVLDLSAKRRDSVETRKTPSPYNASSFGDGSPLGQHSSPTSSAAALLMRNHDRSPSMLHYPSHFEQSPINLRASPPNYPGFQPFHLIPKRETPSPVEIRPQQPQEISPNYIFQAAALQQKIVQSQIPTRESDSVSETDSEGTNSMKNSSQSTENSNNGSYPMIMGRDGKLARPFKAYPRDPLSLAAGFTASDTLLDANSAEKYNAFRKRMLEQIHAANGGQPTISNPKMRRTNKNAPETPEIDVEKSQPAIVSEPESNLNISIDSNGKPMKDIAYYERRRKNNAAAKKSRDRRRIKEDEIAIRAAFLERENIELKFELAAARKQLQHYGVTTSP